MWESLAKAICLMLILEGMLPFLYPGRWRKLVLTLAITSDKQLRMTGFLCMLIGVLTLYLLS